MTDEPMMTLTYLPTAEDYRSRLEQERRALACPGLFEEAGRRRKAQYVCYALMAGSAILYFLAAGTFSKLGLICFCFFVFFSTMSDPFRIPFVGKLKEEFIQSKSRSASQNVFIYEDRMEIRSVYEEVRYPWALLTDWWAEGDYLLVFGNDNVRRIPARALNEAQQAEFHALLYQQVEKDEPGR